ncbi:MAG: gustatory receptor family protein [Clostridia bacterium]|nr:gustatory receptor family protein [Clostridia bacterium]
MKNVFSKWLVGIFVFAFCMILTGTIAKAGSLSTSAKRVGDDKAFIVTLKVDDGESYSGIECDNMAAKVDLVQQQGNIRIYKVSFTDSVECNDTMNIKAVGANGTADLTKDIQVYMHDATDQDLIDAFGDADRGDGMTPGGPVDPSDPDSPTDPDDTDAPGGGGTSYGDPEDLANVLSKEGGVGEVVFDFLYLVGIILTFACLCFLGVNLMINRDKPEDRINTMVGFKYIIIGVILLWTVLLICDMIVEIMKKTGS